MWKGVQEFLTICINENDLNWSISIFDNNIKVKMQMHFIHFLWLKNGNHVVRAYIKNLN